MAKGIDKMIYEFNKLIGSVVSDLISASAIVLLILLHALSVLQLPVPEVINMLVILVVFAFGVNIILSPNKTKVFVH